MSWGRVREIGNLGKQNYPPPNKNSGSAYTLHSGFVSICGANSFSRLMMWYELTCELIFYSSKNSSLNSRHIPITGVR